jgi:hypothetical protein
VTVLTFDNDDIAVLEESEDIDATKRRLMERN